MLVVCTGIPLTTIFATLVTSPPPVGLHEEAHDADVLELREVELGGRARRDRLRAQIERLRRLLSAVIEAEAGLVDEDLHALGRGAVRRAGDGHRREVHDLAERDGDDELFVVVARDVQSGCLLYTSDAADE